MLHPFRIVDDVMQLRYQATVDCENVLLPFQYKGTRSTTNFPLFAPVALLQNVGIAKLIFSQFGLPIIVVYQA